jgi:hypothetical protein
MTCKLTDQMVKYVRDCNAVYIICQGLFALLSFTWAQYKNNNRRKKKTEKKRQHKGESVY